MPLVLILPLLLLLLLVLLPMLLLLRLLLLLLLALLPGTCGRGSPQLVWASVAERLCRCRDCVLPVSQC